MTRKLAVTVFAMSLTLVGCGSSSTTKVNDAGTDAKSATPDGIVAQPDGLMPTGPETGSAGPEVQKAQPDAAVDTNNVTPPADGGLDGVADAGDVGTVNGPEAGTKFDTQPKLDAIDAPSAKFDGPDADGSAGDGGDGGDGGEVG
ncbi:MAG: hypothetical protein WCG85_17440 [Polyangia bacterium]